MRPARSYYGGSCGGADVLRFFGILPPCLVGMEAYATAHYWARELGRLGHTVPLMPPTYVKAYVKRGKTDAADAEAVTRPKMRFFGIKTIGQQAALTLHKVRDLLVMVINALRGHLAEFGIVAARGLGAVTTAITALRGVQDCLPELARVPLHGLIDHRAPRVMGVAAVQAAVSRRVSRGRAETTIT